MKENIPKSQKRLIHETDWEILVILDACRYDYFKNNYGEYLGVRRAKLDKVKSEGSNTEEWLRKTFSDVFLDDTVYFSANPFINSKEIRSFPSKDHFDTVFDVWDWGWNNEYGTILPETLEESFLERGDEYRDKRFILHFEQPHAPYLNLNYAEMREGYLSKLRAILGGKLADALGRERFMEITEILNSALSGDGEREDENPSTPEMVAEKYGIETLKESYKKNLQFALESVGRLVDKLDSWIVVTSDHGEMLGEDNLYGHFKSSDRPILREVPWLEVNSNL